MNEYPIEYQPAQYRALQWQGIFAIATGIIVLIAMGAWAFSVVKKAFKGEEVKFPL